MDDSLVLPPFDVTRAAIGQIEALGGAVRLTVEDGGCCGLTYHFTDAPGSDGDERFGCPGAELYVSAPAVEVLQGARLDWSGRIKPPRFRVLANPNTPLRCPCNRSFGKEWPGRGQPGCRAATPMPWDA
ncbi:HesB/IscA family protein [Antribacter gilvus]|uniref:HesB/IscA family protein n=1 Tax=Antribacter gilvus TaxID=2304675 RepID=UPI0013DED71E|nr:iron-sulfur cluster assembly accessory protein [Antribacter gilvus]